MTIYIYPIDAKKRKILRWLAIYLGPTCRSHLRRLHRQAKGRGLQPAFSRQSTEPTAPPTHSTTVSTFSVAAGVDGKSNSGCARVASLCHAFLCSEFLQFFCHSFPLKKCFFPTLSSQQQWQAHEASLVSEPWRKKRPKSSLFRRQDVDVRRDPKMCAY